MFKKLFSCHLSICLFVKLLKKSILKKDKFESVLKILEVKKGAQSTSGL